MAACRTSGPSCGEAHRRGLKVITELVINHTSDQHPWFQRARRARPGSRARNFYVWSDNPDRYPEARIIFKDFERSNWTWDAGAGAYYWHRFYSHQPDLNFDNPNVHNAVFAALDFWLRLGVDGLRLDAVPYLYEREGTNCENLPETHAFLKELRRRLDDKFENRMLLAEANQWPEDAVAYFGERRRVPHGVPLPGDAPPVHGAPDGGSLSDPRHPAADPGDSRELPVGHLPPQPRRAHARDGHRRRPRLHVPDVRARIPQARINLGIRRRLAPLMGNNRRRIELMNALLFSLPGTPIVYYGDEIGMGDNIYLGDRNGVRTPMQWSPDRNAGFSLANPQRLYSPVIIDPEYHYEALNVESQQNNPHSLLWWMKHLIGLRKRHRGIRPRYAPLPLAGEPAGARLRAPVAGRADPGGGQPVTLRPGGGARSGRVRGHRARSRCSAARRFPGSATTPYSITLGQHAFYWFLLPAAEGIDPRGDPGVASPHDGAPGRLAGARHGRGTGSARGGASGVPPAPPVVPRQGAGDRVGVVGRPVPIPVGEREVMLAIVDVSYLDGDAEHYVLPVGHAEGTEAADLLRQAARYHADEPPPRRDPLRRHRRTRSSSTCWWTGWRGGRRWRIAGAELVASRTQVFAALEDQTGDLRASPLRAEQTNSSVNLGDRLLLKFFRKAEPGVNPDLEIGRFLTEQTGFRRIPLLAGGLELRSGTASRSRSACCTSSSPARAMPGAWRSTPWGSTSSGPSSPPDAPSEAELAPVGLFDLAVQEPPARIEELTGPFLSQVRLLGQRTAEMHVALASSTEHPAFAPEPFTALYRRSLYQSARSAVRTTFDLLRRRLPTVAEPLQHQARTLIGMEEPLLRRIRTVTDRKLVATRIRIHGDYHLGQVLYTGRDFIILDFEGEPSRSISERRFKRSPLRDVAGMIRSFEYAAAYGLLQGPTRAEDAPALAPWARLWRRWASARFLQGYLGVASGAGFLPPNPDDLRAMLELYLIDKTVYELRYELNNRPDWVGIPLQALLRRAEPDGPRMAGAST